MVLLKGKGHLNVAGLFVHMHMWLTVSVRWFGRRPAVHERHSWKRYDEGHGLDVWMSTCEDGAEGLVAACWSWSGVWPGGRLRVGGVEGSWSCDGLQSGKTKRSQRRCTQGPRLGLLTELQIEVSVSQTSSEGLRSSLAASPQQVTMETNGGSSGERSEDDHLLVRPMCLLSVEDMAFPADCEYKMVDEKRDVPSKHLSAPWWQLAVWLIGILLSMLAKGKLSQKMLSAVLGSLCCLFKCFTL